MTKHDFLKTLKQTLKENHFDEEARSEIVEDYQQMIDEALERGEDETDFIASLGSPQSIVKALKKEMGIKDKKQKYIAISPFLSVIIFFLLGTLLNAWHPAWLVFFLTPITAIIFEGGNKESKLHGLSFFTALIVFLLLGSMEGLWHPLWALFVALVGLSFLFDKKVWVKLFGIYTLLMSALYITLVILELWVHPLWVIVFIPTVLVGFLSGKLEILIEPKPGKKGWYLGVGFLLVLLGVYAFIGFYYNVWHPSWVIFLLWPIAMLGYIHKTQQEPIELVAYTPFIATIIFFLWGHYFNMYHLSWLIFFIIPITAILREDKELVKIEKKTEETK